MKNNISMGEKGEEKGGVRVSPRWTRQRSPFLAKENQKKARKQIVIFDNIIA